jgi:hypothetical protein
MTAADPTYTPRAETRWQSRLGPHTGDVVEIIRVTEHTVFFRYIQALSKSMSRAARHRSGDLKLTRTQFELAYTPYTERDKRVCVITPTEVVKQANLLVAVAAVVNGGEPPLTQNDAIRTVVRTKLEDAYRYPADPPAPPPVEPAPESHPPTTEYEPMPTSMPIAATTEAALDSLPPVTSKPTRHWNVRAAVYREIDVVIEAPTLRAALDLADELGDQVDVLSIVQEEI